MTNINSKITVLLSRNIFDSKRDKAFDGYIAICENKIIAVGNKNESEEWTRRAECIFELGDKVVTPGFVDTHTFFSGYVLQNIGIDFSDITSQEQGISSIQEYILKNSHKSYVFGHCLNPVIFPEVKTDALSEAFPSIPVVIFASDRNNCWMNQAAKDKYEFTPDSCYAEKIWRMMPEFLNEDGIEETYLAYLKMLNSRGVTTIKEIGFDDYYGFAKKLKKLEFENRLTARVAVMSQPVGAPINLDYGNYMREQFTGDFVSFQGYNRMTDRGIAGFLGDLIEPYASRPDITCHLPVEYEMIEKETLAADRAGFRYSLHCQGDGAVRKTIDIYDKCIKIDGRLKNRHAITDLEYTDPSDIDRMGKLGIIAEVYAQIQSLDKRENIIQMIETQLGGDRGKNYWNRRRMWDSGVTVSCGTDLPLLFPNVPEAIFCGCGGYFNDSGEPFNIQNMLSIEEMLIAWTRNGQYNCYNDNRLGTLEVGKLADITVLDCNIFQKPLEEMRSVKVCLTLCNGEIVYNSL